MKIFKVPGLLKNKLFIIGLIILIGAGWFFFGRPKKTEPLVFAKVSRETIRSTISSSGILTGKNSATLRFKSSGKLAYMGVKAGDKVTLGQSIASLDTQDLNIALQQAENSLVAAQAAAQKVEDDVKDHSADESFTQKQTRTAAQTTRDSAFDNVKEARLAIANAVITAPFSGTITDANFLPGQVITAADTIAQIVDFSAVYFDTDVDEADIGKVAIGQKAEVSLNAYSDKTFTGTVTEITPQTKTLSTGATVVTVRVLLDNPNINLIANLNGDATIITSEKTNVLTIPQDALKDETTVLVKKDKAIITTPIQTGLQSDTNVEAVSGLTENE